jgi:hypothetical protein
MKNFIPLFFLFFSLFSYSQDDLLDELEGDTKVDNTVIAAFDALKIINLESTKIAGKSDFYFLIAHRFGSIKNGFDDLFGLDQATIKFSFFYGISDQLTLGVARSEFRKTYDFSAKYRLKRQVKNGFPFTIVSFNTIAINTNLDKDDLPKLEFQNRLTYLTELLISRKFNKDLSLQISPIFIHENFVFDTNQDNSLFALAIGGRHRISKNLALTAEYGHHFNRAPGSLFENPVSVGLDVQVGGHVFQLIFSNSQQLNDSHYITNSTGDWFDGDFFFGFNLYRVF